MDDASDDAAPPLVFPTVSFDTDSSTPEFPVEGERKLVTVLFADIKGSVELMEDLDPEDARALLDPALMLMVDAIHAYEGYVVQTTGDGVHALFGAPAAYQDHPRRAVHAGLAMQSALHNYAAKLAMRGKPAIQVRLGITTGEAVVRALNTGRRLEYSGVGHTVNLAARLQTSAPPGSIALGGPTARLVEGYFDLRPLPPMSLKGVRAAVTAYEVTGVGSLSRHMQLALRRGLSKFVGRDAEMTLLQDSVTRATGGKGQIVAIVTDAGTGKSRLLYEFLRTIGSSYQILAAYALSHGKGMPWLPVIDLLQRYFDLSASDDPSAKRTNVQQALANLDPDYYDKAPYLFGLLGIEEGNGSLAQMDPQVRRARTIAVITQIFLAESRRVPLILVFEDLHWADGQTRLLLDAIADSISEARILLLVTCRPEVTIPWRGRNGYTEIRLDPLSASCAVELLDSLLPDTEHLAMLKQSIIDKTCGNPFFIEEIVHSLFEDGAIARDGTFRLTNPLDQLRLPQSVQDTLAERIDKLPAHQKEVLQTLAVIGDRLPVELVVAVCDRARGSLNDVLSDLHRADFIYGTPGQETSAYSFKHALTQEVAYGTLLVDRRRRLHGQVAEAMERIYAERVDEHVSQIAHHYSRTANTAKAIHYLGRAGEFAVQRSAHAEAAVNLRAAIQLLEGLPETPERIAQESRLWLALGVSLQSSLGYAASEVGAAYERARQLSEQTSSVLQLVSAIRGHCIFSIVRAEYETAFSLGKHLSQLPDQRGEYDAEPLMIQGLCSLYTGRLEDGERFFLAAVACTAGESRLETIQYSGHSRALSLSYMAIDVFYLGYPDRALRYSRDGLMLGRSLSIPITIAQATGMCGILALTRRDFAAAEEYVDTVIDYAAEYGFPYWHTLGLLLKGRLIAERVGDHSGLAQFSASLDLYRGSGARIGLPWFLAMRAEMLCARGECEPALRSLDEACAIMQETNERNHEAEIHRLRGELLLMRGEFAAAARLCFQQSLNVARSQAARLLELKAASSLAKLCAREGRPEQGLDTLDPILSWFTEGFDAPDLRDARRLCDDLANATYPATG